MTDLRVLALEDMWAFCELIKFKGGPHTFGELHKELTEFITRPQRENNPEFRRRITLLPREHRKSTINTVLYSLWRIYRNPNIRIAVGCNNKELAKSFIRELRFYLEDQDLQDEVWNNRPHIQGRLVPQLYQSSKRRPALLEDDTEAVDRKILWNALALQVVRTDTRLSIVKEPTICAVSVGMTLSGNHYDLMILDDIVDWDNSKTPVKAMHVEEWAEDLESVLKKACTYYNITDFFGEYLGDELIINGTPYYKHDYYHTHFLGAEDHPETTASMLKEKDYVMFRKNLYVNGINANDGYTFHEEFNDILVQRLRKRIKNRRFSAQYLLKVIASDEQVLTKDEIRYINPEHIEMLGYGMIKYTPPYIVGVSSNESKTTHIRLNMVVDLAISTTTADNCAVGVGGYNEEGDLFLVDMITKKLPPNDLIKEIFRLANKWGLSSVYLEKGGYQEAFAYSLRDAFKANRPLALIMYYHHGNKKARIEYQLQPLLSERKLYMPYWIMSKTVLGTELEMFPSENATDDGIDILATLAEVSTKTQNKSRKQLVSSSRHISLNKKYGGSR